MTAKLAKRPLDEIIFIGDSRLLIDQGGQNRAMKSHWKPPKNPILFSTNYKGNLPARLSDRIGGKFLVPRLLTGLFTVALIMVALMSTAWAADQRMPQNSSNTVVAQTPLSPMAPATTANAVNSSSQSEILYDQGREEYRLGKYESAVKIFTTMLTQAPNDKLAPNARFWLGECYYSTGNFREAIAEYQQMVKEHPNSLKAPEAILKMSYAYRFVGEPQMAKLCLNTLQAKYPKSEAANDSHKRL